MSVSFEVKAEKRTDTGKGASRRLRRTGKIPAIVYGAHQDPVMITLAHNEVLKHLEYEAFYSHILTLNIDGEIERVFLKDLQRHPAKPFILHVDFQRISDDEKIRLHVPLHFVGESESPGVKKGGKISHVLSDIDVTCLPKNLPEFIEVDLSGMDTGDIIHISELPLPEGVELPAGEGEDSIVVTLHSHSTANDSEEEEGESEE